MPDLDAALHPDLAGQRFGHGGELQGVVEGEPRPFIDGGHCEGDEGTCPFGRQPRGGSRWFIGGDGVFVRLVVRWCCYGWWWWWWWWWWLR